MKKIIQWFLNPPVMGQSNILILRVLAGSVFLWEGILKYVYPNQGVGRFIKLGFEYPEAMTNVIAIGEIIGGLMLLFGLFTRVTAFYFIIEMITAALLTKVALYFGSSPLPPPASLPKVGIWAVLHEVRSEYAQALVCLFLLLEGAGKRSLDYIISQTKKE